MKVNVINLTPYNQYIDADGNEDNHDSTHVLGPKAHATIEVLSQKHLKKLMIKHQNQVLFKKV